VAEIFSTPVPASKKVVPVVVEYNFFCAITFDTLKVSSEINSSFFIDNFFMGYS
jgi:hypothetical protein